MKNIFGSTTDLNFPISDIVWFYSGILMCVSIVSLFVDFILENEKAFTHVKETYHFRFQYYPLK